MRKSGLFIYSVSDSCFEISDQGLGNSLLNTFEHFLHNIPFIATNMLIKPIVVKYELT